ncbi:MAG: response regulator [Bacteroidota bacterium]
MNTLTEELKILVVEDEAIVAIDIRHKLQSFGYTVTGVVSSGEEALESVAKEMPDLVLLDISLKGSMSGIDIASKFKDLFSLPVIFITAHSDDITFTKALEVQPYGYIVKPFIERDIRFSIEVVRQRMQKEKMLLQKIALLEKK